jgi:hypothetical protein
MNGNQQKLQAALTAGLIARGYDNAELTIIPNAQAQAVAVGNWRINPASVCVQVVPASVNGKTFPIIELRASGIPALPEISTYNESGNRSGAFVDPSEYASITDWHQLTTSFDNALFGDLHMGKVRKPRTASASVPAFPSALAQASALRRI